MEHFVPNREVIKNFAINTGTTQAPVYTNLCTASELALNSDFTTQEFFVFCDAIQRSVKTGVALTIDGTIKIDANNKAIEKIIGDVHTLLASGTISQFNNVQAKFDLLTNVSGGVLTYTTYYVSTNFSLDKLGGSAEDVGEFAISLTINGTGSISA